MDSSFLLLQPEISMISQVCMVVLKGSIMRKMGGALGYPWAMTLAQKNLLHLQSLLSNPFGVCAGSKGYMAIIITASQKNAISSINGDYFLNFRFICPKANISYVTGNSLLNSKREFLLA